MLYEVITARRSPATARKVMELRNRLRARCAAAATLIALFLGAAQAAEPEYAVQIDAPKDLRALLENNLP